MEKWEIQAYLLKIRNKDPLTCDHCSKAAFYALRLGQILGLPSEDLEALELAAILHDVGKIKVPDEILLKPAALTEDEYAVIKCHPSWGAEMIEEDALQDPKRQEVAEIVRHHHERFDGWGYPDGLLGERIPFLAQIIAIADAYDAMTSDRPYRSGMSIRVARSILEKERGKQFHPQLVDCFVELIA